MSKIKLQAAKELIEEKHYDVARAVLRTVNDPIAQEWLAKLEQIAPELSDIGDPFSNMGPTSAAPRPKLQPLPVRPPAPIRYEFKTVSIGAGLLQNLDQMADNKIQEMSAQGWEFVSMQEKLGGAYPKGRVMQFKRPVRK